jgi:hypothetical protein
MQFIAQHSSAIVVCGDARFKSYFFCQAEYQH